MSRRALRQWTYWLLPLLVARLLVPVGFMVTLSGGQFAIVLCSGSTPVPAWAQPAEHHHDVGLNPHASSDDATNGHGAHASTDSDAAHSSSGSTAPAHGASLCPFALASGCALRPAVAAVAELPQPSIVLPRLRADPVWISPAVLIDRIRGPPAA
jgi:hypothetical protein